MFGMACWDNRTCFFVIVYRDLCSNRKLWTFIVNRIFEHELLLIFCQFVFTDHPRISISDFRHLLVKLWELLLNRRQAATTRWMSDHKNFCKVWFEHVRAPHINCVVLHGLWVRTCDTCFRISVVIRVHYQNSSIVRSCFFYERKHWSFFQRVVNANRPWPNACSDLSSALD